MLMEKFKPLDQLLRYVQEQRGKCGIIYCNSRAKVEDTAARLQGRGFSAAPYHAGLENEVRARVQEQFQRDDLQIVVATVAFGMGINKPNVRFVVHLRAGHHARRGRSPDSRIRYCAGCRSAPQSGRWVC